MAYYQHNMLSIKSRTLLANILAEVVLLSESIEAYREALAQIDYFDCIALFRFLDREEKGYLRQKDFQRAIGTSHRKLLTYAFSWFDNMKVGEVSRLEFAVFLLPKDNLELRQLVAERVENPEISYSQHQTILQQFEIFRKLLLEIMRREMKIIELRRKLVGSEDYSSKGVLVAIDGNDHQWICAEDLFKFMKNYGYDISLRQVEKLVEVINSNMNGKVSEQQLSWTVQGFQTKNKTYLNKIKTSNKKEEQLPQKSVRQQAIKKTEIIEAPLGVKAEFELLMEKMKLAELEEKQVDEELLQYDMKSIQENKKLCETKLQQVNNQKLAALRLWEADQRQKLLEEEYIRKEIESKLIREQEMKRQAEQLRRLEIKLKSYADYLPYSSPTFQSKRLYSFAEDEPVPYKPKPFQIIDAHLPLPRKDYQHLTNLNSLSIVESHRKVSGRSDAPQWKLTDRSDYLNSQIKEKLRQKQLDLAKQSEVQYNTSRFNSRVTQNKDPTSRVQESPNAVNTSQLIYESPERAAFKKNMANKYTVSTGVKLSPAQ